VRVCDVVVFPGGVLPSVAFGAGLCEVAGFEAGALAVAGGAFCCGGAGAATAGFSEGADRFSEASEEAADEVAAASWAAEVRLHLGTHSVASASTHHHLRPTRTTVFVSRGDANARTFVPDY
jgi:hypothetical protein